MMPNDAKLGLYVDYKACHLNTATRHEMRSPRSERGALHSNSSSILAKLTSKCGAAYNGQHVGSVWWRYLEAKTLNLHPAVAQK